MSPWQLLGEPNRARAIWLSAGDQISLGGVSRLFSHSLPITVFTYIIKPGKMQGEKSPSHFRRQGLKSKRVENLDCITARELL